MHFKNYIKPFFFVLIVVVGIGFLVQCQGQKPMSGTADAAQKVYVAPGEYDEFYFFASGGFSGQVTVHGLPSGRLLKTIPVFSQYPENGWGYAEETPISRYVVDALVLPIFEGVKPVLELKVIARNLLQPVS